MTNDQVILGFDPGKDKCGIAVMGEGGRVEYHQVVGSIDAIATINRLCQTYPVAVLVMGNQTTAKTWKQKLDLELTNPLPIIMVDERYSTLEARDRYWQMYPPTGIARLIPQGMRTIERPIDDIVAILLIERYLSGNG